MIVHVFFGFARPFVYCVCIGGGEMRVDFVSLCRERLL